jgi:hypothetical protein
MTSQPHTSRLLYCIFRSKATYIAVTFAALFSATSCKKAAAPQPVVSQNASGGSLAGLSAEANAEPAALQIPGSKNISIDGGTDSFAKVSYLPAVKTFELSEIQSSLQGISSDGHGFVFKNASSNIRALKTGDILLVKGELAVKVVGAITEDDTTLVLTNQASLADIVQGGEINIDAPVRFHGPNQANALAQPPMPRQLLDFLIPPVYAAQSGLPGSGADVARQQGTADAAGSAAKSIASALTDGWKIVQWSAVAGDGQLNFHLVMSKDTEGYVAMVAMKGWIGNFDFASNIKIDRSAPSQVFQGVKNIKGNMEFDWEIGKASPGVWAKEDRVKLPAAISIPLAPLLEGMPLTLDISSALLIHPALTGGDEYSKGGFSLSWGNGNVETAKGGAVPSDSTIETTFKITSDANVSPIAPNGMVISYCAPRIELRFDVLGKLAESVTKLGSGIDKITSTLMSHMPQSFQDAVAASPLSKITANNILTSNADVFVQFLATEGVTHASNISPMPCSKQEIKFDAQGGLGAQLFGLTGGAQNTTTLFTKTMTRWDPASDFCKKV